ncbi:kinesin light chain 3 [Diplogelasinospora grovesii]|uniref:Kinesin light chain 3 n=1 Tax=Diplogelasinospora grovesii TaxID=303347 RepID=A0AAN6N3H5_9PEZI|nr:kinesin light chain 3 [Diplogelasinospora grovesii]
MVKPSKKVGGEWKSRGKNAYSTGAISRHNVVLAHMPGIGTANAAAVAANYQISFLNIRLTIMVGICGAVPFNPNGAEIVLSDVIINDGRRLPERFMRKDTTLDSLSRLNAEIRVLLAKLKGRQLDLVAQHPGVAHDRLFKATKLPLVPRSRLEQDTPPPVMHFGLVISGDTVIKSGEERDTITRFPCVVIKGACDYTDSYKTKVWQRYAAATAAAFLVPYPKNDSFIGRTAILRKLQQLPLKSASQARVSLFRLNSIGKTQIALAYVDVLPLWLMVLNNADDAQFFFPLQNYLRQYIPECAYRSILVTIRNKQAGLKLVKGRLLIEVSTIDNSESEQLLRANLKEGNYLQLLNKSDQGLIDLLSEEFKTQQHAFTGKLLSLISFLDRQAIPLAFLAEYGQSEEELQLVTRKWLARKQWMDEFAGKALLAVDYENWVLCRAYLPHAYAALRFEGIRSRDEEAGKAALLHCDAKRFQQEAFKLRKVVLREEHPDTLTSMANLASTVLGEEHPDTLISEANLASTLRVLGEEHPDTLASMANLASTLRVLGEEHPDTLTNEANLASTYRN